MEYMSMDSEISVMPYPMDGGIQIQTKKLPMGKRYIWIGLVLTYDNPIWYPVCAGETQSLALSALCRIVGATDK
jgi:hypothetical protein